MSMKKLNFVAEEKQMKIDVSVIVTVYNIERYIAQCLDSLLAQKGLIFEIICVDDVSTDKSLEILQRYRVRDARIRIIQNQKNMGPASSRNIGFRNALGEYWYCIDGDDMLYEGALYTMYQTAKDNDLDLLGFSAKSIYSHERFKKVHMENEYVRKGRYDVVTDGRDLFCKLIKNGDHACSALMFYIFKAEWFVESDLFAEEGLRFGEDTMFKFYMMAQRAMCIPDCLHMRRFREGSAVTSHIGKRELESLMILYTKELFLWDKLDMSWEQNTIMERYFNNRLNDITELYEKVQNENYEMPLLKKHVASAYMYKRFICKEPLYVDFIREIADELNAAEKIVMYGAGKVANEIADALEFVGFDEYKVVVTQKKENHQFHGKEVLDISELRTNKDKTVIMIAIRDDITGNKIKLSLEKEGYKKVVIFPWVK